MVASGRLELGEFENCQMPEERKRFNLTAEDLAKYSWQEVIADELRKECDAFWSAFNRALSKAKEESDDLGARVYSFMAAIASFHPQYDSRPNTYAPMWSSGGKRSLVPEDLESEDLDLLESILSDIRDPEFRARVADVLWVSRKDYQAATIAVGAFVESAERLEEGESWPPFVERLDRAAQIAARKGFESSRRRVVETVERAFRVHEKNSKTGLACARLMRILLRLDEGDKAHYAALAEDLAKRLESIEDWRFSQEYWEVTAAWHQDLGNDLDVQRCIIRAAECDVSNAEGVAARGGQSMSAAHWMSRGLEGLRQAKADPERIKEVHARLLEIQESITDEMGCVEFSEDDIPNMKENREKSQKDSSDMVSGVSFEEAVKRLALVFRPTNLEKLKKREAEADSEGFLGQIFGTTMMDGRGRTTDHIPGVPLSGEDDPEVARKRLVNSARTIDWRIAVEWRIEPARIQILQDHPVRLRDLNFLVRHNPFIEPGHEGIYLKGIQAGFFGDWVMSMHLLVPQIESSTRWVLKQNGITTSKISSEGIQEDFDLNKILWMKEVEELFGSDILFDLRGILIERFGCNLRNKLAHGLMREGDFIAVESPYLWWLVLLLLYKSHLFQLRRVD